MVLEQFQILSMATLAPGILLKLLDAMNAGRRPFGHRRTALLQVTDIVPVGLDEKDLWPTHGFYVKVSDSSHSIYASLPVDQDDLILSNKLQLGQFIQVDQLDPGTAVPVLKGARPVPGRHPLMGSQEHITRAGEEVGTPGQVHTRSSWGSEQFSPISAFSPKRSGVPRTPAGGRRPASESVLSRVMGSISEVPAVAKIKSLVSSNLTRSKSLEESQAKSAENTLLPEEGPAPSRLREKTSEQSSPSHTFSLGRSYPPRQRGTASHMKARSASNGMPLPRKLDNLGKEAIQQRVAAKRVAIQALRDASATETLVRIFKTFSSLSTSARFDIPTACFNQFLSFNQELTQAITHMEETKGKVKEESPSKQEEKDLEMKNKKKETSTEANGNKDGNSNLENSIQLARKLKVEAGNWFMEFLEAALRSGLKQHSRRSCSCPQSLLLKVINWLEVEQSSNLNVNLKAAQMIKVLRKNLKNL